MKKRCFRSRGIGLSIFPSATALLIACSAVASETRYVSKTANNEPPYTTPETGARTIQAALDASSIADVVMVGPGDYEESISVQQDGIVLMGAGRDRCRIIVSDAEDSVGIAAAGYGLEMHDLAVVGGGIGVSLAGEYGPVLIADCLIEKPKEVGLSIGESGTVHVVDTVFRAANIGIQVRWHDEEYLYAQLYAFGCQFLDNGTGIHGSNTCVLSASQCSFLRNGYGIYGGWGAVILVDSCRFEEGTSGVVAMTMDGVVRVSDSVFTLMFYEAIETDQSGVVTDSLFYANGLAFDEWDGGYKPDFIRCTFVSNRTALGRIPNVLRDCIFWNNGGDLPEFRDGDWPQTRIVEHCLINDPDLAGKNGNISGNPEFVGWGAFNDADNPVHVDGSSPPGGVGSADKPFSSLQEALLSYDFRLRQGSVCIGAGTVGGNIGSPASIAPFDTPRADAVAVEVAPWDYEAAVLIIPPGVSVYSPQDAMEKPSLRAGGVQLAQGARVRGLIFRGADVHARGADLRDCEFIGHRISLDTTIVVRCKVLGGGVWIAYGSSGTTMSNCLILGGNVFPALEIPFPEGTNQIIACTIASAYYAVALSQGSQIFPARFTNCIIAGPAGGDTPWMEADHSLFTEGWPGEGNIAGDPGFVDAGSGDFRLLPGSPCIDAGFNSPELPEFDLAGMHRVMFGGKSLTVDMGAYEFFYTGLQKGPGPDEATLVWSFVPDRTYSIFYTDDLFNWHTAIANFPSLGNETTYWTDDGSLTGIPPLLAPKRFYRLLENP